MAEKYLPSNDNNKSQDDRKKIIDPIAIEEKKESWRTKFAERFVKPIADQLDRVDPETRILHNEVNFLADTVFPKIQILFDDYVGIDGEAKAKEVANISKLSILNKTHNPIIEDRSKRILSEDSKKWYQLEDINPETLVLSTEMNLDESKGILLEVSKEEYQLDRFNTEIGVLNFELRAAALDDNTEGKTKLVDLVDINTKNVPNNELSNLNIVYKATIEGDLKANLKELPENCKEVYNILYKEVQKQLPGAHKPTVENVVSNLLRKYLDRFFFEDPKVSSILALDYIATNGLKSIFTQQPYIKMNDADFSFFVGNIVNKQDRYKFITRATKKLASEQCEKSFAELRPGTISIVDKDGTNWYCLLLSPGKDSKAMLATTTGKIQILNLDELKRLNSESIKKQQSKPPSAPSAAVNLSDVFYDSSAITVRENNLITEKNTELEQERQSYIQTFNSILKKLAPKYKIISEKNRNGAWLEEGIENGVLNRNKVKGLMDLALLYEVKFQFPDNNFDKLSNQKLLEAILYYSGDDK